MDNQDILEMGVAQNPEAYVSIPVDFCQEPMLLLDDELRVIQANKAFCKGFGLVAEAIGGQEFFRLKEGLMDVAGLRGLIHKVKHQGQPSTVKVKVGNSNWQFRACRSQGAPGRLLLAAEAKAVPALEEWASQPGFLRQVLDTMPLGVWITDAQGQILYTNPMAHEMWGGEAPLLDAGEYSGYKCWWPETGQELKLEEYPLAKVLQTQQPVKNMKFFVQRFDGTQGMFSTYAAPLHDSCGNLTGSVALSLDITQQQEAQQLLARERELLERLFQSIPVMLTLQEPSAAGVTLNRAFHEVTGWTPSDVEQHNVMELLFPDPQYRAQVAEFMQSFKPGFRDIRMAGKKGNLIISSWANIRLDDGRQVGIGVDITERKAAERAIEQSEERFATSFRISPDAMLIVEKDTGILVEVNQAWTTHWGYDPRETIGRKDVDLGLFADPDQHAKSGALLLEQGHLTDYEMELKTRQGELRHSVVNIEIMKLQHKELLLITIRDVTQQRQNLQQLQLLLAENRSQKDFLQTLLDSTKAGIAVVAGDDLRFKLVNETCRQTRPSLPAMGHRFRDVFPELAAHDMEGQLLHVLATGESLEGVNIPFPVAERPHATWDYQLVRLPDEKGQPPSALIIIWETTQHKRLEKSLRHYGRQLAEANQELKAFSYSVSHDMRTPLITIDSFASLLQQEHARHLDEEANDYLSRIRAATARMHLLIEDMLVLSRINQKRVKRQEVHLSHMIADIAEELRLKEPQRSLKLVVQENITAHGDPGMMKLLLQNLLENAWKFTRQRPDPSIEFGCLDQNGRKVFFVRDNGIGFEKEQARRIFEPFRSMHGKDYSGSGVGLSIVQRVVKRHRGEVWAQGEPGKGAVIFFTLD